MKNLRIRPRIDIYVILAITFILLKLAGGIPLEWSYILWSVIISAFAFLCILLIVWGRAVWLDKQRTKINQKH